MDRRACVALKLTVRRVARHPLARRSVRHVVRDATFGILPSAVNDIMLHHAPLNVDEILHVTQDSVVVSSLTIVAKILSKL